MKQKPKLPLEISYLRMAAQLLLPSLQKQSVTAVTEHMLAMQGQQVYSFPHAVLIRTAAACFSDVETAFERHLLIRHRPMRGTVHVTCAEDYHWLRLTLNQKLSSFVVREEAAAGITEPYFVEAAEIAWEAIAQSDDVGVSRKELFALWIHNFKHRIGDRVSETRFCELLMWGLDRRGLLVEGPLRKNRHLFIDARKLPAADSSASGFCFRGESDLPDALAEVAYRYVRGHGPIAVADLARWASLSKSVAKAALHANVEQGRLNRYQLTVSGLEAYKDGADSDSVYYMQAELPATLERYRNETEQILFLPAFDELHVGYENRSCLTDEAGELAICPKKNGMFIPIIVENGRLIAVYPKTGISWQEQVSAEQVAAVDEAVRRILTRMAL